MRTIRISDEVWDHIAKHGRFGETPDRVLRRLFRIENDTPGPASEVKFPRTRQATQRMTAKVVGNDLMVKFERGSSNTWPLPPP